MWGCTLAPAAHLVFLGWEVGDARKILRVMRHEVCFPPKLKKGKYSENNGCKKLLWAAKIPLKLACLLLPPNRAGAGVTHCTVITKGSAAGTGAAPPQPSLVCLRVSCKPIHVGCPERSIVL